MSGRRVLRASRRYLPALLAVVLFLSSSALASAAPGPAAPLANAAPIGSVTVSYAHPVASHPSGIPSPVLRSLSEVAMPRPATHVVPAWTSSNFSRDIAVSWSLPYVGALPFAPVPIINPIPQSVPGFWMNITTLDHKPIVFANVTIWGTQWPVNNVTTDIPGFPSSGIITVIPMLINPKVSYEASFYFDDYRYFWPGDTVSYNLTVTALNSTPATVYSDSVFELAQNCGPTQQCNYASWQFYVQGPWVSPDFNSSVNITTTPDVLGSPSFDPNPYQPLNIQLTAIAPPGQSYGVIPEAELTWTTVYKQNSSTNQELFTPLNHSTVGLTFPIGPYPGSTIFFNITLWLPWGGGAIDRLYSPSYKFTWSSNGGWWFKNQGLLANLELSTWPSVLPPTNGLVPAGTPVNVTLHETKENVTIASSQVYFIFHDGLGLHSGSVPMVHATTNTTYAVLPGLPPGASVTFFLGAKDVFGQPIFSSNYTYSATGASGIGSAGHGTFYFEALDIAGTGFVPNLPFTISNASWTEGGLGTSLGYGAPTVPQVGGFLPLAYGQYALTVTAFGRPYSTVVTVANATPFTVVFYVASAPIPETTTSSLPAIPLGAVLGLAGATGALILVLPWFIDRRRRMEEEQRRVTL